MAPFYFKICCEHRATRGHGTIAVSKFESYVVNIVSLAPSQFVIFDTWLRTHVTYVIRNFLLSV
jgi:hypothetical protein